VKSRAGLQKIADLVWSKGERIAVEQFDNVHCLIVDECQFLDPEQIDALRIIADRGCPVICYGLRTDFRRELFPGSKRLMELADSIEEVKTTCYFCNKKAVFNLKMVNGKGTLSGAQIDLGCEEKYLPTCARHFTEKTAHCLSPELAALSLGTSTAADPDSSALSSIGVDADATALNVSHADSESASSQSSQQMCNTPPYQAAFQGLNSCDAEGIRI